MSASLATTTASAPPARALADLPATTSRELARVTTYLGAVGYAKHALDTNALRDILTELFDQLVEPQLEAITLERLETAHRASEPRSTRRRAIFRLAHALHGLQLIPRPLSKRVYPRQAWAGVDPVWADWGQRWHAISTLAPSSRRGVLHGVLKAGRWLKQTYPTITTPDGWTRDIALAFVAAVNQLAIGDWSVATARHAGHAGSPISPRYQERLLGALRTFFRDVHDWGWCRLGFDPYRAFATPRAVKALIGPNPRVIADEIWAKLLWAGLNLAAEDRSSHAAYPFTLVKALTITWLFAGLRSDELVRLRVGCIRWQAAEGGPGAATHHLEGDGATCLLDVPTHKTGSSYTKPVDPLVGAAIAAWEAERPTQPPQVDRKTGEAVATLFSYRGRPVPPRYINGSVIPVLCRKAGVPGEDARGRITSHRARSTIASQLYNAKEPMTLLELQAWLGHRTPLSTQYYARITPNTLTKAYADAGYFARNVRTIEVLVDREAIQTGDAARGVPWQYFDLGHGFCTYTFFEQCPHRLACARCDFYLPKPSTRTDLIEAKGNLQRMLAQIPLTDDEKAAVTDGDAALAKLLDRLADAPTPAGPTPRQLSLAIRHTDQNDAGSATTTSSSRPLPRCQQPSDA